MGKNKVWSRTSRNSPFSRSIKRIEQALMLLNETQATSDLPKRTTWNCSLHISPGLLPDCNHTAGQSNPRRQGSDLRKKCFYPCFCVNTFNTNTLKQLDLPALNMTTANVPVTCLCSSYNGPLEAPPTTVIFPPTQRCTFLTSLWRHGRVPAANRRTSETNQEKRFGTR